MQIRAINTYFKSEIVNKNIIKNINIDFIMLLRSCSLNKETFLNAIDVAEKVLALKECLDAIGLSFARYYARTKKKLPQTISDKNHI